MSGIVTGDGVLARAIAERLGDSILIPNREMAGGILHVLSKLNESIIACGGKIDYLINNYGYNHLSWIGWTPYWDGPKIFEANVIIPYYIIDHLVAIGHPPIRIINVASQTYKVPQRCTSLYCASKAALVHMTKVMARELAPKGWIINAIAPGKIVGTEMSEKTDEQVLHLRGWSKEQADRYALGNIPMGDFTNPDDVASAIAQMLDLPSYINGTCIDMTGGV